MVYDIIVVENLYFRPCTQKRYSNVFNNLHAMDGCQKSAFLTPQKFRLRVDRRLITQKNLSFQKYPEPKSALTHNFSLANGLFGFVYQKT